MEVNESEMIEKLRRQLDQTRLALERKTTALDRQLEIARQVHESLLPRPVRSANLDVDIRYLPIDAVGGDYCQVRFADSSTCYITMCDVTGHGIGPSLLAARVSSEVRHFILYRLAPRQIVESLNTFIFQNFAETNLYLSFIVARIDLNHRRLTFSGAGHPPPLLIRRNGGTVEQLKSQNPLIGVFENGLKDHPEDTFALNKGDRILFYTDGITETFGPDGDHIGIEGLSQIAQKAMSVDLFEVADYILDTIGRNPTDPHNDDKTIIVAEVK